VVYLYNGPGGTSFDTTLKPSLIDALKSDVPYLKSIGDFADLDIGKFAVDDPLRAVFAANAISASQTGRCAGRSVGSQDARESSPASCAAAVNRGPLDDCPIVLGW